MKILGTGFVKVSGIGKKFDNFKGKFVLYRNDDLIELYDLSFRIVSIGHYTHLLIPDFTKVYLEYIKNNKITDENLIEKYKEQETHTAKLWNDYREFELTFNLSDGATREKYERLISEYPVHNHKCYSECLVYDKED